MALPVILRYWEKSDCIWGGYQVVVRGDSVTFAYWFVSALDTCPSDIGRKLFKVKASSLDKAKQYIMEQWGPQKVEVAVNNYEVIGQMVEMGMTGDQIEDTLYPAMEITDDDLKLENHSELLERMLKASLESRGRVDT